MKSNTYRLDKLLTIRYGKNQKAVENPHGEYPIYGTGGLMGYATNFLYDKPSILIGRKGTIGKVHYIERPFWTVDTLYWSVINTDIVYPKFLYYKMLCIDFNDYNEGTTIPSLRTDTLNRIELDIPDLETQKKVVRILSALDEKIELNNKEKRKIQEIGRNIYINNFEKDSSLKKVKLGDFFPVRTGKKDANASSPDGKYPFFTCSQAISRIADYSFDDDAILLAGNGDFNVKFYRGKFDTYQRTYVLIPKDRKLLGFLYWAISCNLPKITANYRGSVIKFITKGNIENFEVPFSNNEYVAIMMMLLKKIESFDKESEILTKTRDALLPKLMNGEIELNGAYTND